MNSCQINSLDRIVVNFVQAVLLSLYLTLVACQKVHCIVLTYTQRSTPPRASVESFEPDISPGGVASGRWIGSALRWRLFLGFKQAVHPSSSLGVLFCPSRGELVPPPSISH